jgi:multidrug efflux pump subunit AcrA (membrane-fusion protein)
VPEQPGKTYSATVEASAQSVTPSTGTTLMQIIVDNPTGEMMPGDYASIHLAVAATAGLLSLPSSTLIFDAKGLCVATLDASNQVQMKSVSIVRDLGTVVEVASGVTASDRVIDNPPDGLINGTVVRLESAVPVSIADSHSNTGKDHG